jgi:CheY-like chemotaxis protein
MPIKVLWVEDEPSSLRFERILAEQHGWHVTLAETGSRGFELVRDTTFDLVVVDLILAQNEYEKKRGHVDPYVGIHFIESVRERTRSGRTPPDVPILVITAVATPALKARVVEKLESERYYLTKPLEEEVYGEVVGELTQRLAPSGRRPSQPACSTDN